MASLNKVFLIGNLTRDPELRYTPSGMAVCDLGLATTRRFAVNNQEREETCFVDITVWGKVGENCKSFLEKGSPVMVEGRLQLDQWEDQNGVKKSKLRVVAESVQFLGSRKSGAPGGDNPHHGGNEQSGGNFRQSYNNSSTQSGGGQFNAPPPSFNPPPMPGNYAGGAGTGSNVPESEEDIPF